MADLTLDIPDPYKPKLVLDVADPYGATPGFLGEPPSDKTVWALKNPEQQKQLEKMSGTERFLRGIGAGLQNVWEGVGQLTLTAGEKTGISKPETTEKFTEKAEKRRTEFEPLRRYSPAAKTGEFMGETAPYLAVPGLGEEGLLGRMAYGAVTGGLMGATQFVPSTEESPMAYRGINTGLGAITGAGGAGLLGAGSKGVNAMRGKAAPTENRMLLDKFGIRDATYAEETKGKASWGDIYREQLPWWMGGIKPLRERQRGDAENAVKGFFSKYVVNPSLDTTAEMKIQNDAHLDVLYDKVRANAQSVPLGQADKTKTAVTSLKDEYPNVFESLQNTKVKRILNDIYGDVQDQSVQTGILNAQGKPIAKQVTPTFSFDELWKARMGLGKEIGSARDDIARGQYKKLYEAVSEDIESILSKGKAGSELADFKKANDAFKQYSVKFDALREAFDKAEGTTSAHEMFSPKTFSTNLKKLANDPNYKKNVQWTKAEIDEMTGLANVLQVVKRGAQYMETPPTGKSVLPLALLGVSEQTAYMLGGATGAAAMGEAAAGVGALGLVSKFLTTTPTGKNLLTAASRIEPTSKEMQWLMRRVYEGIPKALANGTLQWTKADAGLPQTQEPAPTTEPKPAQPEQEPGELSPRYGYQVPSMVEMGNIDWNTRPIVPNPKGGHSSVYSMGIGTDRGEVLIPQVSDDGRIMSEDEARQQYQKTGKHLGIFKTVADANAYAEKYHAEMGPRLSPAIKTDKGVISEGPDLSHDILAEKNKLGDVADENRGFTVDGKNFMDRKEALAWVKTNEPDIYEKVKKKGEKEGLHSGDYARAKGIKRKKPGVLED